MLDTVPRCYPLLHPNLVFTFVFGDSVESVIAEERRLFYVALTRAVKELFILTETNNSSRFLKDLELCTLEWSDYPPLEYITIKVDNQIVKKGTYAIRKELKDEGYSWNKDAKYWYSAQPVEVFSVIKLDQAKWSKAADGIVVRFCDDLANEIARYHVDGGQWKDISGNIDNIPELPHDDIPF